MKRVNVLILESIFHMGGAEKNLYNVLKRIDKDRYNFVLCTLYHPGPMGTVLIESGYKFYHDLIKSRFDMRAFFKLKEIIRKESIDLIYLLNQPLTLFWGFVLGKSCKKPVVSFISDTMVTSAHPKLRIYRILLPFVDGIIAQANMHKDHLVNNEKLPEKLISVIYNGIDIDSYDCCPHRAEKVRSLGLDPATKIVGIVGRLVHLKGVDVFLRAARCVLEEEKRVQFMIVGDGPEMSRLKLLATELNIDDKVHFFGFRDDLKELLSIFDVAVLASRTEASPMVLLEYMASRKAIVATNVGSVPEFVLDHDSGFLVEPENPGALAEKIILLLRHEKLGHEMGAKARDLVNERCRIETTAVQMEALIRELV